MCLSKISKHISPVRKNGLKNFLANAFLSSQGAIIDFSKIQFSLKKHENDENEVHERKTWNPPESKHSQMNALQLIATGIFLVKCNNENPSISFALGSQDNIKTQYLIDHAWKGFFLV